MLLDRGQARLDRLNHLHLRIGLRVRDMLQSTAQLFLPLPQLLHMLTQMRHLPCQRFCHPGRAIGRTQRQEQQQQDQRDQTAHSQDKWVIYCDLCACDLDHVI